MDIPVLHLNLKNKWFDMVDSYIKEEEYRDIKPYWNRIFISGKVKIKGRLYDPTKETVKICFSNGYRKDRRQIEVFIDSIEIGYGNPKWGANTMKQQYIIKFINLPF